MPSPILILNVFPSLLGFTLKNGSLSSLLIFTDCMEFPVLRTKAFVAVVVSVVAPYVVTVLPLSFFTLVLGIYPGEVLFSSLAF